MRDRLAAESPQEREARLQQMRDRLAAESPEGRDSRLQNMSILQRAVEGREVRLQLATGCQQRAITCSLNDTLFKQIISFSSIISINFTCIMLCVLPNQSSLRLAPNRCPASSLVYSGTSVISIVHLQICVMIFFAQ